MKFGGRRRWTSCERLSLSHWEHDVLKVKKDSNGDTELKASVIR